MPNSTPSPFKGTELPGGAGGQPVPFFLMRTVPTKGKECDVEERIGSIKALKGKEPERIGSIKTFQFNLPGSVQPLSSASAEPHTGAGMAGGGGAGEAQSPGNYMRAYLKAHPLDVGDKASEAAMQRSAQALEDAKYKAAQKAMATPPDVKKGGPESGTAQALEDAKYKAAQKAMATPPDVKKGGRKSGMKKREAFPDPVADCELPPPDAGESRFNALSDSRAPVSPPRLRVSSGEVSPRVCLAPD